MQKHKAVGKMLLKNSCKKVFTGFLFFISLFIISISCDSTDPPPPDETKPTLTLAIGDATGHGMKAGTTVSMVKALFASGG
jgi:hypothetical protein